jgi:hypothetical protein
VTNGSTRHYAADEIVAPALIALKARYDEARGGKGMAAFDALPPPHELPGPADLALIEVSGDGRYVYLAMGEQYRRTAALKPDADGVTRESRPVVRQHLDLAFEQRDAFHVSITRWDGPKILQYDRLILPLDDGAGIVTHMLLGEVFLRVAKPG